MRPTLLMLIISAVLLGAGCADSRSIAVASSDDATIVSENGEVSKISEIDPEATEVRVWLCWEGKFVFDNESCHDRHLSSRSTIQETIRQKYPSLKIIRILRGRETSVIVYTVYYVSLKK